MDIEATEGMRSGCYFWVDLAMTSTALFGPSTPFAKLLLGEGPDPWMLAGLLYAGSGLGLFYLVRHLRSEPTGEAQIRRAYLL